MVLRALRRRRRGQGMTEYIIIVGLIAIVLITAVTNFSEALERAYNKATEKIDGVTARMDGDRNAFRRRRTTVRTSSYTPKRFNGVDPNWEGGSGS